MKRIPTPIRAPVYIMSTPRPNQIPSPFSTGNWPNFGIWHVSFRRVPSPAIMLYVYQISRSRVVCLRIQDHPVLLAAPGFQSTGTQTCCLLVQFQESQITKPFSLLWSLFPLWSSEKYTRKRVVLWFTLWLLNAGQNCYFFMISGTCKMVIS